MEHFSEFRTAVSRTLIKSTEIVMVSNCYSINSSWLKLKKTKIVQVFENFADYLQRSRSKIVFIIRPSPHKEKILLTYFFTATPHGGP